MIREMKFYSLLFAGMIMILSSVTGCATGKKSADNAQDMEIMEFRQPSVEDMEQVPEGSIVQLDMTNGKIFGGAYISYSLETASVLIKVGQDYGAPSAEFNNEEGASSFVLEEVAVLTVFESPNHSGKAGISIGIASVIAGLLTMVALAYSTYN